MLTPDLLTRLRAVLANPNALPVDPAGRRATLAAALLHSSVVNQIDYSGPSSTFVSNLILKLDAFGSVQPGVPALVALLQYIRNDFGYDKQEEIDALIAALRPNPAPPPAEETVPDKIQKEKIVSFLEGLTSTDLNRVIVRLESAASYIPDNGDKYARVFALIQYVYSNTGPGQKVLMEVLKNLFPNNVRF